MDRCTMCIDIFLIIVLWCPFDNVAISRWNIAAAVESYRHTVSNWSKLYDSKCKLQIVFILITYWTPLFIITSNCNVCKLQAASFHIIFVFTEWYIWFFFENQMSVKKTTKHYQVKLHTCIILYSDTKTFKYRDKWTHALASIFQTKVIHGIDIYSVKI